MIKAQRSSFALSNTASSLLLRDLFELSLEQFISEGSSGSSRQDVVSSAVSAVDTTPNSYFLTGDSPFAENISQFKNIFLSGVTGFLGSHLLQDLLENSSANVHCLVRASPASQSDATRRLHDCLQKYNVTLTSEQLARVIVHNGDLALPLFGLPEDQFLLLSQSLDAVIHNGAHVNWLMTYAQLRPSNVLVCWNLAVCLVLLHALLTSASLGNRNSVAHGSHWQAQVLRPRIYSQVFMLPFFDFNSCYHFKNPWNYCTLVFFLAHATVFRNCTAQNLPH